MSLTVAELVEQYALSEDCTQEDRRHLLQLAFAMQNFSASAEDVSTRTVRAWKLLFARGEWTTPSGEISGGWCRNYINAQMRRLQRAYKWAFAAELVSQTAYLRIDATPALRKHGCDARETEPVGPVEWGHVLAIRDHILPIIWDMITVQYYTGMRNYEVCKLNVDEITKLHKDCWLFNPKIHKTSSRSIAKSIAIGPQAIKPIEFHWPEDDNPCRFIFRSRRNAPYSKHTYTSHIRRAIKRAKAPYWHPHQLRHTRAMLVDQTSGREAAAAILGNTITATKIYAERNIKLAIETARQLG